MSLFNDMINNIKQIVIPEDDDMFDDDSFSVEPKNSSIKFPFGKKDKNSSNEFMNQTNGFDLNSYNLNSIKNENANKKMNNGHIQVYVPKSYEQSFEIIKDVKDGITAMVNVEACNPQISQRIIDVISGGLYALGGQCKKMGEKQYIFSMNAEMTGAYDYLPGQGMMGGNYNNGFFNNQNPFSFDYGPQMGYSNNQMYNQPMQYQNPNSFDFSKQNFQNMNNQQPMGQQNVNNQNSNMQNQNNNQNQVNFDFKDYYIPPQYQF